MVWPADRTAGGDWPMEHHEPGVASKRRIVRYGVRIDRRDPVLGKISYADATLGDIKGAVLWPPEPDARDYPSWGYAAPALITEVPTGKKGTVIRPGFGFDDQMKARPVLNEDYEVDEDYLELELAIPEWAGPVPVDWPVVGIAGWEETSHERTWYPAFYGLLAANEGNWTLGTRVFDIDDEDRADIDRYAQTQSSWRVIRPREGDFRWSNDGEKNCLAWQLGVSSGLDRVAGYGFGVANSITPQQVGRVGLGRDPSIRGRVVGPQSFGQLPTQTDELVIAAFSTRAGGPLEVSGEGDKHRIGRTADGEPINRGHLSTQSIFLGKGGDATLEFQDRLYPQPPRLPHQARAHLVWDPSADHETPDGRIFPGLWRWYCEVAIYVPPEIVILPPFPPPFDPKKPPPPLPPEDGDLFPPGRGDEPGVGEGPDGERGPTGTPGAEERRRRLRRDAPPLPDDLPQDQLRRELERLKEEEQVKKDDDADNGLRDYRERRRKGRERFKRGRIGGGDGDRGPVFPRGGRREPFLGGGTDEDGPVFRFEPRRPEDEPIEGEGGTTLFDPGKQEERTVTGGKARIVRRPWDDTDGHEAYAASSMELAAPSFLFRASDHSTTGIPFLDHNRAPSREDLAQLDAYAPIIGRIAGLAQQPAGAFAYGERPSEGRFVGGTCPGMAILLPPEVDLCRLEDGLVEPARTESEFGLVAGPGTYIGFGEPLAAGGLNAGWRLEPATDDNGDLADLKLRHYNTSGVAADFLTCRHLQSDIDLQAACTRIGWAQGAGAEKSIDIAARTSDAAAQNLAIKAQDAFLDASGLSNPDGGHLKLDAGDGNPLDSGNADGGRIELTPGKRANSGARGEIRMVNPDNSAEYLRFLEIGNSFAIDLVNATDESLLFQINGGDLEFELNGSGGSGYAKLSGELRISGDVGGEAGHAGLTDAFVALGGGASATLGTIGGSGPSTAAQAEWWKLYNGTSARWVAVWS